MTENDLALDRLKTKKQFDPVRVIEHLVHRSMVEVSPTMQSLLRDVSMSPELFDSTYRAGLICRGLVGKVNAIAELYGEEDETSRLRMASYDLDQFFSCLADQMNQTLGLKTRGEITYILDGYTSEDVVFDARRVCMIVYHLVSNAILHGRTKNKNIELICACENKQFTLTVRDHGGGVPKEKVKGLFTQFHELFNIEKQSLGAFPPRVTGLGLPLCRKLAEDMGGTLTLKNHPAGAKFILTISQKENRFREKTLFQPDDALLLRCMADTILFLAKEDENKGGETE